MTGVILSGRRNGKTAAMLEHIRKALTAGEHVHVAGRTNGARCIDGPADCPTPHRTVAQLEQELRT